MGNPDEDVGPLYPEDLAELGVQCPRCGRDAAPNAKYCGACGRDLRDPVLEAGAPAAAVDPVERSSRREPGPFPGGGANAALRIIGGLTVLAGFLGGLWILSEFGSAQRTNMFGVPVGGAEVSALGVTSGIAVIVHGLVVGVLLIALAGMGDNLIGIRQRLERE